MSDKQTRKSDVTPVTGSTIFEINKPNTKNYSAQPNTKNPSGYEPKFISDKLNQTNNSERNNNE